MDLSSQEEEIPIPISSSYGHGRMIHHEPARQNQIIPNSASAAAAQIPSNGPLSTAAMEMEEHVPYKRMIKYRECLKNHAAAMGGNATDGCGEFMPSGEEGTLEALTCSACNCHRNFHRKEVEGEPSSPCCHECFHSPHHLNRFGRKLILGHLGPESQGYPTGPYINSRPPPPPPPATAYHHHQMMMSYNTMGSFPSESDEQEEGGGGGGGFVVGRPAHHHHHQVVKKRFRTKFTQEQKEKMLNFAEKVGWKIQKQEESMVQQFCQEIGVKRRVLKVWMHNNKHNLAKKNSSTAENINPI